MTPDQLKAFIIVVIQEQLEPLIAGVAEAGERRFREMIEGYAEARMGTEAQQQFESIMENAFDEMCIARAMHVLALRRAEMESEITEAPRVDITLPDLPEDFNELPIQPTSVELDGTQVATNVPLKAVPTPPSTPDGYNV